ncbi:hypothetical protein WICMUC_004458 [Wickerhamomyces mucosus]|uniref:Uncharacterized protein n=1 Tax=Wickerhamomyces mucosus TaxID=1378264 RepID=A0A9P8PIT6_9ASCO|nr:hypothetical protein WICMUC_004458 [Wickerhamomyces mucosus]
MNEMILNKTLFSFITFFAIISNGFIIDSNGLNDITTVISTHIQSYENDGTTTVYSSYKTLSLESSTKTLTILEPSSTLISENNDTNSYYNYNYEDENLEDIDYDDDDDDYNDTDDSLITINSESFEKKSLFKNLKQTVFNKQNLFAWIVDIYEISPLKVLKLLSKVLNNIKSPKNLPPCTEVVMNKDFKGLCKVTESKTIYLNNNRSPIHIFRTFFLPTISLASTMVSTGLHYYTCIVPLLPKVMDPIHEYFACQAVHYYNYFNQAVTACCIIIGYQDFTGKPFYPISIEIIKQFKKIGFNFGTLEAISWSGEHIPLKEAEKIPKDFDLNYLLINYSNFDMRTRDASIAFFMGDSENQVGVSFLSKPYFQEDIISDIEEYDWKFIIKIDLNAINYGWDRVSPEEIFWSFSNNFLDFKDALINGGGLFANNMDIFIDFASFAQSIDVQNTNVKKDKIKSDDQFIKFLNEASKMSDEEIEKELQFSLNNGVKFRVSIEKNAKHTVDW